MGTRALLSVVALATGLVAAMPAFAQAEKGARLIVPFAPGGGTDILARIMAPRLAEKLGQPVVVENRPGAAGAIATRFLAQSAPDGQTLMIGTISEIAINPHVNPKIGYDVWRDLAMIAPLAFSPITAAVHPSVPAKSIRELIDLANASPGKLNFGSAGTGSGAHMAGELFRYLTKVNMTHVPYKGVGPAVADLVGGQIQVMFTTVPSLVSFAKAGQVRALGIASAQRAPQLPDVPTFIEGGLPEYLMDYWYSLVAPAATPRDLLQRINAATQEAMRAPDVVTGMERAGLLPMTGTVESFTAYAKKESDRWAAVVKAANIRLE